MKLDPVLLNMACSWSMKAYNDSNKDAIKIESKWTSTTVYIAKRKTVDVIAFRGTEQKLDILTDINVIPLPYAGRLCHGGFTLAHKSVWKKVKEHIDPKKRTLITGHSLGGGLAELSAAMLMKGKAAGDYDNINLITFGKPNVFFKGFKKPMTLDNQISCVQGSDIVATIPKICYGPSSSQTMLYFGNSGVDFVNPDKLTRDEDRGGLKDRITDHMMAGYKDRLKSFLEQQEKEEKKVIPLTKEERVELKRIEDEIDSPSAS
jgi:hypothetical protein